MYTKPAEVWIWEVMSYILHVRTHKLINNSVRCSSVICHIRTPSAVLISTANRRPAPCTKRRIRLPSLASLTGPRPRPTAIRTPVTACQAVHRCQDTTVHASDLCIGTNMYFKQDSMPDSVQAVAFLELRKCGYFAAKIDVIWQNILYIS